MYQIIMFMHYLPYEDHWSPIDPRKACHIDSHSQSNQQLWKHCCTSSAFSLQVFWDLVIQKSQSMTVAVGVGQQLSMDVMYLSEPGKKNCPDLQLLGKSWASKPSYFVYGNESQYLSKQEIKKMGTGKHMSQWEISLKN